MSTIVGTAGYDYVVAPETNDTVNGLGGDDSLHGGAGDDSLTGDDGDDTLWGDTGSDTLDGGAGNDVLLNSFGPSLLIGGDGDDTLNGNLGDTLQGGAGNDLIYGRIQQVLLGGAGSDLYRIDYLGAAAVIGDFTAGAGGDALDLERPLYASGLYRGGNPFGEGLISLRQDGADAVVEIDLDGPAGPQTPTPWVLLKNVAVGQLTADNFLGFKPDGGPAPAGLEVVTDSKPGSGRTTSGSVGADTISGGSGYDIINGGAGDDLLRAGAEGGDLRGDTGSDTLIGGAGGDTLYDQYGANLLDGGAGDDTITGGGGSTMVGGSGSDTFVLDLTPRANGTPLPVVTDFQAGEGGDIVSASFWGVPSSGTNLFMSGHLRLAQDGSDVVVLIDRDGWGGQYQPEAWITLEGVTTAQLTAFNFAGSGPRGGSSGNDTISASSNFSYLRGEEGNDRLFGHAGFDDLNGNTGNDTVIGGDGDDWVVGGKDDDLLNGDAGDDICYGNLGNDWCDGGAGNDIVRGGQGDDRVLGQAGDDWLSGDRGDDTLIGGAGADTFHSFGDAGLDRILDFNAAEGDRVLLDAGSVYAVSQQDQDIVIDIVGGARVVLAGVQASSLPAGWLVVD